MASLPWSRAWPRRQRARAIASSSCTRSTCRRSRRRATRSGPTLSSCATPTASGRSHRRPRGRRHSSRSIFTGWMSRGGRARRVGVQTGPGESAAGAHDFRHMFAVGALDIAHPSMTKIGGIGEMRRIAALAEVAGVRLVPHCAYFGPGFLAALHTSSVLAPDAPFERLYVKLEASPFGPWLDAVGGKMKVPDGPGLGCDPDMAIVERYRSAPDHVTK